MKTEVFHSFAPLSIRKIWEERKTKQKKGVLIQRWSLRYAFVHLTRFLNTCSFHILKCSLSFWRSYLKLSQMSRALYALSHFLMQSNRCLPGGTFENYKIILELVFKRTELHINPFSLLTFFNAYKKPHLIGVLVKHEERLRKKKIQLKNDLI